MSHTAVLKQAGAIVLKIAHISLKVNVPGYGKSLRTKSSKTTDSIISGSSWHVKTVLPCTIDFLRKTMNQLEAATIIPSVQHSSSSLST